VADGDVDPANVVRLVAAWALARREWAGQGPRMLERNLRAMNQHYGVETDTSRRPPTRLLLEWCEDGAPTPAAWIDAKQLWGWRDGCLPDAHIAPG
jgi:hypothetical protein